MTDRPETANYTTPIDEEAGAVMTVEEYLNDVAAGGFSDYDGMGDVAKDGLYAEAVAGPDGWPAWIKPSDGDAFIPKDATHIVWYNR